MFKLLATVAAVLATAPFATGHTWIEQMRNIDKNGNYVGQYGYPRGYKAKTDPGYDGFSMNFGLPAAQQKNFIDQTTPLCHPNQTTQKQSQDKYPRLQTPPGGFVALRYMENGHVTEPISADVPTGRIAGKPDMGGTIFVYGTTEPKEDEKLATVINWTKDGQGGDKRGKLLTMNDFDDGRCYEINSTPKSQDRAKTNPSYAMGQAVEGAPGNFAMFCETDVQVPETAELGKTYTLYWVWQWNTKPGDDPKLPGGKDEWYTTCMDVDVTSADKVLAQEASKEFALGQQDAETAAVSNFASRTALMTDIVEGEYGFPIFKSGGPTGGSGGNAPAPTSDASASSAAPSATSVPPVTSAAPPAASAASSSASAASSSAIVAPPAISSIALASSNTPPTPSFSTVVVPAPVSSAVISSSAALLIPTLSGRPGAAPTPVSGDDNPVTVTNTVMITVTAAPALAPTQLAASVITPRAASSVHLRDGAKFRTFTA
jgi:hypothetical protein